MFGFQSDCRTWELDAASFWFESLAAGFTARAIRLKLRLGASGQFDALELCAVEDLATVFETRFIVGVDFATILSSLVTRGILFEIPLGQLPELKWLMLNKHKDGSTHHVWTCSLPVCLRVGSWCRRIWFGFLGPGWFCQINPSSATLWVRDTCLIVWLLPLMIILITASLSSKM